MSKLKFYVFFDKPFIKGAYRAGAVYANAFYGSGYIRFNNLEDVPTHYYYGVGRDAKEAYKSYQTDNYHKGVWDIKQMFEGGTF